MAFTSTNNFFSGFIIIIRDLSATTVFLIMWPLDVQLQWHVSVHAIKLQGSVLHKNRAASGLISINLATRHQCEWMIKLQFHFCSTNPKDERSCWRCSATICSYFEHTVACNLCLIFLVYACCYFYCYIFLLVNEIEAAETTLPILHCVSFIECIFLQVGAEGFSGALLPSSVIHYSDTSRLRSFHIPHAVLSVGDMKMWVFMTRRRASGSKNGIGVGVGVVLSWRRNREKKGGHVKGIVRPDPLDLLYSQLS